MVLAVMAAYCGCCLSAVLVCICDLYQWSPYLTFDALMGMLK